MQRAWGSRATPMRPSLARLVLLACAVRRLPYGMGSGAGTGATPQISGAQGGRGVGVGMRNALPWVDAVPPVMH
jgi:hypothetical protein